MPWAGCSVLSRTTGLPGSTDDIGNWSQMLGAVNLLTEAALILLAVTEAALILLAVTEAALILLAVTVLRPRQRR